MLGQWLDFLQHRPQPGLIIVERLEGKINGNQLCRINFFFSHLDAAVGIEVGLHIGERGEVGSEVSGKVGINVDYSLSVKQSA